MKWRNSMRVRHIILVVAVVLAVVGGLVGCDLLGIVSVSQRVSDFQNDLNLANRSMIYQDFHPTLTSDYDSLKSASLTLDSIIPPLNPGDADYTLTITDQKDPATGVFVTIDGGASGFSPQYLKLTMATTGTSDYRIVTLAISTTQGSFASPNIQ
jgi:hypothetical protein